MIRRAPLPKAIRSRALHLIFFKFPIRPRLALGTFVGNVHTEKHRPNFETIANYLGVTQFTISVH